MSRILIDNARPVVESDPARADIALFVGLARAIAPALPSATQNWLTRRGWTNKPAARPIGPPFLDIPIPIESYVTFASLFDPGGSGNSFGTDYLATAVRSFFAQGGRRCYVVRMGDPLTPDDLVVKNGTTGQKQKLASLLPDTLYAADDRRSWRGVGHLGGLPDVSFLALPDLPALCASQATVSKGVTPAPPSAPPKFVRCRKPVDAAQPIPLYDNPAPRLTPDDYHTRWAPALTSILTYLSTNGMRELQFVAPFPLPQDLDAAAAHAHPSNATLAQDIHDVIRDEMRENVPAGVDPSLPSEPGLSTGFLQLAYPWLTTGGSYVLNESLEPPDGALVGLLARNALTRGAYQDATKVIPAGIADVSPYLPARELAFPSAPLEWGDQSWKPLVVRLSLFGFTPAGPRLLSDVTAYPGEAYRPARIQRLVAVISRAARQLGEHAIFRQNGPVLWTSVEDSLTGLMTQLWNANALDGDTLQDAFTVRCDASTMTQNDRDNGRLVARITFTPAASIELIRFTLAMETSGAGGMAGIDVMAEAS